ncbi:cysteine sulfinic acid decarboxylase [Chelonus insularis]|uniref:cysteine sulfinic acid decarboxylase n=1 Tax=Chelonus insularis TaxID=460826 RepID=UPI00158D1619|nr:cysteine sulfinic acid decarboxylase [Chelonus insularis]
MPANEGTFDEILEHQSFENLKDSLKTFSSHSSDDSQEDDNQVNTMANSIINGTSSSYYQSTPIKAIHEDFFRDSFEVILQHAIFDGTSRKTKVVEWIDPEHLPSIIDLRLSDNGIPHDELLNLIRGVIKYSVKTGNPRFINQLFSSVDPYGLVGQWLTDALNPSVYTYEVSPVFSLMENQVLREMRSIIGWAKGDGIFCPGGSIANGYAINLARHHKFPKLKESGLAGLPRLVVFTSEDAHYSVKKLAAFLGIGTNNVYCIKVDSIGKMDVNNLEEQIIKTIQEGAIPLMVSATAGTTVLGVFDPIRQISALCQKYDLWLHVDAAWGGGALISKKHKKYLDGIELADSVTWNPHKLLAAPQQCSTLLIRHENLLQSAHCSNATYLFQKDKFYDTSYDSGDKHIQCGRRADVLKFWLMWKAKGTSGFEKHVDRVFHLSRYFTDLIRNREGWKLLQEPECTNVCFWYIPKSKRHLSDSQLDKALHKIAPIVKERMIKKGSMLVTYQPIHGKPNFFRFVLQNSALTEDDMRYFVNEFEVLSEDL